MSDADLVTRIGRLEATIRELTGNVEQLQYRNQQLEQQVQRLQAEAARGRREQEPAARARDAGPTASGPEYAAAPSVSAAGCPVATAARRRAGCWWGVSSPAAPGRAAAIRESPRRR